MAQFAFLYRGGDPMPASPAEMQKRMEKWLVWFKDLTENGYIKDRGIPLDRSGSTVVATGPKKHHVTDGPYAEKDLVIGLTVVEASDLAHASELSMKCPIFEQGGCVEVRPILSL
jgi:hypothetical protein